MICPKCGARLAQGSTICPICGTKIRPSKVKVQDNYEEQPDQGYDSDSDDDYEENLNDDYDYDEEDDSYGNDDYDNDDYEPARPKTNRILVVIIVTVIALIAAMIVLIVLLFSSGKKSNKQIPYTVDKIQDTDTKKETQKETQKETETEVVEIKDNKVTSGRNVYELSNDELKLVEYNDQGQVVRIPAEIGGYSVTSIGSHAFKNNTSVQYLKLPDGMKKLDDSALSDIELLKEVVVPESVEEIGNLAFSKVQKAICVKGSFAWNYMKYMADEVVEGTSLSLDNNASTPSSSAQQTVPTQPTTAQQAASQPQPQQTPAPAPSPEQTPATAPSSEQQPATNPSPDQTPAPAPSSDQTPAPSPDETPAPDPSPDETPAPDPSPDETPEAPTERNAENILAKISADSGGSVVGNSYMFYDFNGNGVQEAFALVDVGGRKEIWYNGEDSTSNAVEIFPITDVASCSVNAIANGTTQFVLSVTTSTGESYSCIYGADGANGYMVADLLPGVFVSDGVSLQLDNGMNGVAYLLASDGGYSEYAAQELAKSQFDAMPGAQDIWSQVSALIGAEPTDLHFWNRSSAVGNLIQIAFTDAAGTPSYINVSWTQDGMQFEDGALNVHNGVVKSSYTGLNQIQPQEVPQVETEPADPATEISFADGTAVTLSAEGTNYTADLNGDGAADFFKYRTEVAEDGSTTSLIVNVNGTDYTVGTGISAAYKVEVCDLNTSDNQLNIVVVGTGADNSVTSFRVLSGTDLSTPLMQDGTFTVLNGYGNAARLYNTSHVLTPSSTNGTFDENGGFTLAVTSPISIDSLGRYVCKIPYELKDGVIAEDALSETTGNYEYELVDLTSQEQFNYILAADTNLLSSAAADAAPAATLGTGTQVFPRKLIQAANEPGAFYLYVEDASGNAGYLPLGEGQTLFQSVPQ
ncbi:leucine-rich repeat protein [Lachnoclostridium sp. 210928-DFI.6.3]|nr:leucine-rich repeat protein [Lachnoclostridium sp. 210928-DFI.6.3]